MTTTLENYAAEAGRIDAGRPAHDPAWLTRVRRHAIERFQSLGFPTTRDEEWRFTSVAPIADRQFRLAANGVSTLVAADLAPFRLPGDPVAELVFVNGRYAAAVSHVGKLPAGVVVESLAKALVDRPGDVEAHVTRVASVDRQAFTALNTAFLADGAFVLVPPSTAVDRPIHLLFVSVGSGSSRISGRIEDHRSMAHPRVLVVAGAGSEASIVESYVSIGADGYLTNTVTEIAAGPNATLNHYKLQRESAGSYHIGAMHVHAARDANVASHAISFGGSLVRNDIAVVLDGEGGECTLNGLYLSDGRRLVDNHTTIDHAQPHCSSREVYKGILADRARAVFNGKIIVRPDAQKTDAKQTNKALLLSEEAQINTKPQLEIFANDVKCTHGAAVGQMDEEAIFYLRARGLSAQEARRLLIHAFAGDVLNRLPFEPLRARLEEELLDHLPRYA